MLDTDEIDSFDCVNKREKTRSRGEGKERREDKMGEKERSPMKEELEGAAVE